MKERASLKKANWTHEREGHYLKACEDLLFERNEELVIAGDEIYLKSGNIETLLLKVYKQKSIWYETWLKLKPGE